MPKVSERERIEALEQKLKQLKTLQQRREAKARSVVAARRAAAQDFGGGGGFGEGRG
jgi:type II secretory pathway component PulM